MKRRDWIKVAIASVLVLPLTVLAQSVGDLTDQPALPDATVNFGPVPPQPPFPANHVLVPDEVTIFKGGTVTFIVNGNPHSIAIYPVSRNTTRRHIEEDLCQGGLEECNPNTGTQNLQYHITDGDGNLIIDSGVNPPDNRVNYVPGQLMSAGAGVFLVGATVSAPVGTQVKYRFLEDGRYLVICMTRSHFLNDRMFGFVNVR